MQSTAKAGIAYAAIVFAIGFVFGTLRVLAVAPHLGATLAVAIGLIARIAFASFPVIQLRRLSR